MTNTSRDVGGDFCRRPNAARTEASADVEVAVKQRDSYAIEVTGNRTASFRNGNFPLARMLAAGATGETR